LKNASLAGLLIAVAGIMILLFTGSLFATTALGIAFQVMAGCLMLWARITFGRRSFHASADPTEGGLVTTGPYRYFRHPIYASLLYFVWTGAVSHASLKSVELALMVTLGLSVRMAAEEQLIAARYPEYKAYAARTKRVIPFIF
jgi:protein-S-isoprenylcysteine O-methyltransferase Ste14